MKKKKSKKDYIYCGHQFKFNLSKKKLSKITHLGSYLRFTDLDKIK